MGYQAISYEIRNGVAYVTLNRPELMNALNAQMRREITQAFQDAQENARAVVMTGAGVSFCSGQDLADASAQGKLDMEATLRDEYVPMLKAIFDCKVPTICAVNGPAAGAGANLALAADVVIASEDAYFVQAFTRIGLIPDAGGTYWLPRQIGAARAMGAALFADKISATQARDWGMIYETAPAETFEAHVQSRAEHLAHGPTVAYAQLKTAMRGSLENTLDEQLAVEAKLQAICGETYDFKEGVAAFLEKRAPRYEGR
ncbi:enoyl-CoA hydratase-related protein [Loktanella sp. S4079]|uniref:enoyl-CoA hydratase-related protein n=1 Tax=Loktanella sp. S4079 TaxID=579483 RepID=UPI0005F9E7C2|nr:enoyl-CoA hydratase-related protein [Loktanella sp. S4079]KJZ19965.1 enoyl-CoA hydratase [Loktanella sp. S4079]